MDKKYSDIDISLAPHPGEVAVRGKGDIMTKDNEAAVKQSIRNLINLNLFDKPFHPEIAANVRSLLFENTDALTATIMKRELGSLLARYEPRAVFQSIEVNLDPDANGCRFIFVFNIINTSNPLRLEIRLDRVR